MPETNFLTSIQEQEDLPKPKKKMPRKTAKNFTKADKSIFKAKDNLNIRSVMPKSKLKVEESSPNVKKGEAKNIYRKFAFSFIALTIVLVAAVLYFGLAKVTLVIIPTQEKITDSLSLGIVDKDNNQDMSQGEIQGVVRQVPVEQARTFTSSGKEVLGEEVSGKVTIINNYLKNQPLVATTRLLSQDNKLFRLKNTVNVPAGGQVEVAVYADEPSASMAIGPSQFTIPGLWAGIQDKIYAQSQEPMKYSEKIKYTIKQSDIDNAVSELKNGLLANAKKEIAYAYAEYDQSILQVDNNSINQEVQGKVGEEREKFTIKMKTLVTVVAFKDNDVFRQAEQKLSVSLADDREILELSRPDMSYSFGEVDLKQGTASVNVNFAAKVTLKNSAGIIKKNNLAGLNLEQVNVYLKSLPEVAGYEIKFFPSFIKKMPNLVDRIEIVIKK
ncbi:MAG: hypothetical protein UU95_C0001G0021 [Parcubacteria group bacterium GW2011_GWC2_42_12]|uniref:Baseplate protein J-like domain-containing protein n=1 Tax=Candidatus Falkowbacteria bacterium RIFCSPHIGHO2_02_FULL_42_9 TaxID=1797986 RepID=A0A1F5S6B3_9BACT|nr:MAG: hypothetical protein UU95_C0001G0021 [Parcubacteria group bacterium GW2011_GWC2_42_12]OGF22234.1 MAG: hypothetical protein A3D45_00745 [Candidatus Falkowbacteria bacterium RIFCSPHIGHO2_02_FULL_42_9]